MSSIYTPQCTWELCVNPVERNYGTVSDLIIVHNGTFVLPHVLAKKALYRGDSLVIYLGNFSIQAFVGAMRGISTYKSAISGFVNPEDHH